MEGGHQECSRAPSKTKEGTGILLEIYQDETIHYRFSRGGLSILAEVTTKSPDLNPKRMSSREKNGGTKRQGQWRDENGGTVMNGQEPAWCQKARSLGSPGLC